MIITLLLNLIVLIIGMLFVFFPIVTLEDIPAIGFFVSDYLTWAVQVFNSAMETFPYAETGWFALKIILIFELGIIAMRFFLGSRTPINHK